MKRDTNRHSIIIVSFSFFNSFLPIENWLQVLRRNTPGMASGKQWIFLDKNWRQRRTSVLRYGKLW